MEFIELLAVAAVFIFVFMSAFWIVSIDRQDAGIADVAWGLGFIVVSFATLYLNVSFVPRSFLVMALVLLWGLRLASYIIMRNKGKGEDWRYAQWRKDWGKNFLWRSYVQVFLLQGLLMLLVSVPVIFVHYASVDEPLVWIDIAGALVWFVGFVFETVGDYQLMIFKAKPRNKGKVIKSGLWAYTRHPNYFGEIVQWWGIFIIALALADGVFSIIGPLTISYLILRVSGIPLLEKKYKGNKEYEQYKKVTSGFFPWFPKRTMGQKVK